MQRWWFTLFVAWACVNAAPLPSTPGEVAVLRSDVDQLDRVELLASQGATSLEQSLEAADRVGSSMELGDSRSEQDERRANYERRLHGDAETHQKHEDAGERALLKQELKSAKASITELEAAAEARLQHDKEISDAAMKLAVNSEGRREQHRTVKEARLQPKLTSAKSKSEAWGRREAAALRKVGRRVAEEAREQTKALKLEKKLLHANPTHAGATLELPDKVASKAEAVSLKTQAQLKKIAALGEALQASVRQPKQRLGEARASLGQLKQELRDAVDTKNLLVRDARGALHEQQHKEQGAMQHKLEAMREQFGSKDTKKQLASELERQKEIQAASHVQIGEMLSLGDQVQSSAKHEFQEFESIMQVSHNTKRQADNHLTSLEARMIALKTQRSLRLMHDDIL